MKPVNLITVLFFVTEIASALSCNHIDSLCYDSRVLLSLAHSNLKANTTSQKQSSNSPSEAPAKKDQSILAQAEHYYERYSLFSFNAVNLIRRTSTSDLYSIDSGIRYEYPKEDQLSVLSAEGLVNKVDRPCHESSNVILPFSTQSSIGSMIDSMRRIGILNVQNKRFGVNKTLRFSRMSVETPKSPYPNLVFTGSDSVFKTQNTPVLPSNAQASVLVFTSQNSSAVKLTAINPVVIL